MLQSESFLLRAMWQKRVAEMPKCFCSGIMNQMLKNFRLENSDQTQLIVININRTSNGVPATEKSFSEPSAKSRFQKRAD